MYKKAEPERGMQSKLNYTYRDRQLAESSSKRSESYLDVSVGAKEAIYKALRKEKKSENSSHCSEKILTMTTTENSQSSTSVNEQNPSFQQNAVFPHFPNSHVERLSRIPEIGLVSGFAEHVFVKFL